MTTLRRVRLLLIGAFIGACFYFAQSDAGMMGVGRMMGTDGGAGSGPPPETFYLTNDAGTSIITNDAGTDRITTQ